jgi:glycosyltransferase involved in cell wall biosynthesis
MRITVIFLTYNRYDYAEHTLKHFLEGVHFSGELAVHIADDGSPGNYVDRLRYLAGCYDKVCSVSHSITNRLGYGANYNVATQMVHGNGDLVFPLEDDWELTRSLDLDTFAEDLLGSEFGCIRMGYVGWTQQLVAQFVGLNQRMYLHLLPSSQELHVFSGHPRLEKVAWARNVGLWPEGVSPGDTEVAVSFRKAAREGVLWPLWMCPNIFEHIGTNKAEW